MSLVTFILPASASSRQGNPPPIRPAIATPAFDWLRPFLITTHVSREITEHYQEQLSRLKEALEQGILEEIPVNNQEEVETFAKLAKLESLGNGECACIAVAVHRGYTLAIDDKKAIKQARLSCPTISIVTTEALMVSMIKTGLITVSEADTIKDDAHVGKQMKPEKRVKQDSLSSGTILGHKP